MSYLPRVSRRGLIAAATAVAVVVGGVVTLSTGGAAEAQTQASTLPETLDGLLNDSRYVGSQVGLVVRDATTGETLYDHNGGDREVPASNVKFFTSTAAMHVLGPTFTFHTDVLSANPVESGTIHGNLYLKGYGDPTTVQSDYASLAKQLATAGVTHVDGDLVADDSYFDSVRLGDSWGWDDEPAYYAAQISALTLAPDADFDTGTAIVETRPGATAGAPVALTMVPANSTLKLVNTATTGSAGSAKTLSVQRDHGSNVVRVTGSVPLGAAVTQSLTTVWEPELYAADVFRKALAAVGITVSGKICHATTPALAKQLARDESMPLGDLLIPFLKKSNNIHAETLVKTMGVVAKNSGTWAAGLGVIADYAKSQGVDTSTIRISDGSGLTRKDNLTGNAITNLLIAAQQEPWFQQWYNALPIAGNPAPLIGGTLATRMQNTPAANNLHGKTGSLTGASALSGYVTTKDGRKLVFSMLSNNYITSPRSIEDAVGVTLASWSDQAAPAKVSPDSFRTSQSACDSEWTKAPCSTR
ncbi:D-alanyl-D-alanine carboxypeptidase/D-alanyl-D-alanine endopeptidase [Kribbella sp. NPDC055071]